MNKGDNKAIDVFSNGIFRIKWQEHVSTKELLERAGTIPLSEEVRWRRWKMVGHILRQDQNNECNVAMTWAQEEKRKRGRPRNTWRRTGEKERRKAGWDTRNEVRATAADREGWKRYVKASCATWHEEDR